MHDIALIIDDDPDICDVLATLLCEKFEVVACSTAQELESAIGKIRSGELRPKLALVDQNFGRIKGHRIVAEIKAIAPHIHAAIVTGLAENDPECLEALNAGAAMVITKPILSPEELFEKIDLVLTS